jgi:hypothetical protein
MFGDEEWGYDCASGVAVIWFRRGKPIEAALNPTQAGVVSTATRP